MESKTNSVTARQHHRAKKRRGNRRRPNQSIPKDNAGNFNIVSGSFPELWRAYPYDNQVYSVAQTYTFGNLVNTSATVPTFASANFKLSDLDQYASFTNVFDQYRIICIEAIIYAAPTASGTVDSLLGSRWLSVVDYDDSTNLTSVAAASDYTNAEMTTLQCGHFHSFRPHAAVAAYSGSFTSYANEQSPWLDAASANVQHYGIKIACETSQVVTPINCQLRYHVQFRNVR
jgi:hypothetical protein